MQPSGSAVGAKPPPAKRRRILYGVLISVLMGAVIYATVVQSQVGEQ